MHLVNISAASSKPPIVRSEGANFISTNGITRAEWIMVLPIFHCYRESRGRGVIVWHTHACTHPPLQLIVFHHSRWSTFANANEYKRASFWPGGPETRCYFKTTKGLGGRKYFLFCKLSINVHFRKQALQCASQEAATALIPLRPNWPLLQTTCCVHVYKVLQYNASIRNSTFT